jgi:hypothetical protein
MPEACRAESGQALYGCGRGPTVERHHPVSDRCRTHEKLAHESELKFAPHPEAACFLPRLRSI